MALLSDRQKPSFPWKAGTYKYSTKCQLNLPTYIDDYVKLKHNVDQQQLYDFTLHDPFLLIYFTYLAQREVF